MENIPVLVNWESWPYFLGMMGKQVRREQKEMPAVVCLLSVKMEMKSNQKVISRLVFFAGLFSILLTFTYTNRLSTSTCVESKLPWNRSQPKEKQSEVLTVSLLLSEFCWKQICKALVPLPRTTFLGGFSSLFSWAAKLCVCILKLSAGRMHQGTAEGAARFRPACRGCGWTDNEGGESVLWAYLIQASAHNSALVVGCASWRDLFLM